ncbi:MAG TPA: DUF362 domain-containing protein [Blastocatellia bacterium]|nr:DUF362 domain-containing protein [Blastocatellia bacterium]
MKHHLDNFEVAVASGDSSYPENPPFNPPERYPESPFAASADSSNHVYSMVRDCLRFLRLDDTNFGTPKWNPLGCLISPGQRVLIKPNFVLHFNAGGGPLNAVVTHPSIIRAIVDYVVIALGENGSILIGDSPQMNCDFQKLNQSLGMDRLAQYLNPLCASRGIELQVVDFRDEQAFYKHGIVWNRRPLANGSSAIRVALGKESFMEAIDNTRLYGADYDRTQTIRAHDGHKHEYIIASAVLNSDVVISVPKLKVHRKVGTTLNLKNMVGINCDKNHLAHYRVGSPTNGGDEFSSPNWDDRADRRLSDMLLGSGRRSGKYVFLAWRAFRKASRIAQRRQIQSAFAYGNWHGNDTAWRMVLDLNRILMFADRDGNVGSEPVRKYFSVIDGIIGGEGEGPLHPDAYPSGVVLAGFNPVAVDWVATRLMGFDPAEIPLYQNAVSQMSGWLAGFAIERFSVKSDVPEWQGILDSKEVVMSFRAPAGWRGQIERYPIGREKPDPSSLSINMLSQ